MIRDLMFASIECRFGSGELPKTIQWLSDNGSCYWAHETVEFAMQLGFVLCFIPVRTKTSNAIVDDFIKTCERDYVNIHDRPDARTVLAQLPLWFEDYNESLPQHGLSVSTGATQDRHTAPDPQSLIGDCPWINKKAPKRNSV